MEDEDDGDDDDGDGVGDDVAEGLEGFMIRANGGICILLHMSLSNGRLHAGELMMNIILANRCVLASIQLTGK